MFHSVGGLPLPIPDSYAFVFELEPIPELTEAVVKEEFLKYYRGLCMAVLNGKLPQDDPLKFTLELQRAKTDATIASNDEKSDNPVIYRGTLEWVEPFATKKPQTLHLDIQTWTTTDRSFIFACVSPQARDAEIWKQLHKIRDGYLTK